MQFAVALIEYLISGIVASVWITAIARNYIQIPLADIKEYKEIFVIVYFPIAYILGIYVDTTSSFLIRRAKEIDAVANDSNKPYVWLRNRFVFTYEFIAGKPKIDSYERSAEILSYSIPDAVRTMEAYVSRDRIARGVALNSFAGAITALVYAPCELKNPIFFGCMISFIYSLSCTKDCAVFHRVFKQVALSKMSKKQVDTDTPLT